MNDLLNPSPVLEIWLSTQVTIQNYLAMELARDTAGIAKFIHNRFAERYILPLKNVRKGDDNGFLTIGVCCLLIEGLTAFREGWPSTDGKSKKAFQLFFGRESQFEIFRGVEDDFWKGIRCGILHQGETAMGWRLNFTNPAGPLFEPNLKRVNVNLFFNEMETTLRDYRDELTASGWDAAIWVNLRTKMKQTIEDCK
jgi:hypothetical protein